MEKPTPNPSPGEGSLNRLVTLKTKRMTLYRIVFEVTKLPTLGEGKGVGQ